MNVRWSLVAVVVGAVVVAALAGCGREGSPCLNGTSRCASSSEAVLCVNGRIARSQCRGPRGCQVDGTMVRCDQSVAAAGERCTSAGAACSVDHASMLRCTNGRFAVVSACRGPAQCHVEPSLLTGGEDVQCDLSRAVAGDPCTAGNEGNHACSVDGTQWLVCRQGRFAADLLCRGPNHCTVTLTGPNQTATHCDDSLAVAGDACPASSENDHACSLDGSVDLVCRNGRMEIDRPCRGARRCHVEGETVRCDGSLVEPGDVCSGEAHRCSMQGGNVLHCVDGHFEPDPGSVPGSCRVEGTQVFWTRRGGRSPRIARRP